MASTYTSNSGVEKPGIGDQSGEWGTTVNTNMDILDRAINGVGVITLSGTTHTLTTTDGALSDGQYKVLVLSGSPSGTNTITISPNDQDKLYFVVNNSGQTATFSQGSGANVSVVNGDTKIIYADGAGSGAAVTEFASEADALEGITAGTVSASKAVIVDANKDITGFRNVTLTGELDAGSLDISGNADIDGTLEADAMTLDGTAITTTATLSTGISNTNVPVFTTGVADDDFLRVAGTSIEGRSASEVLSDIGGQASLTFGISNTNAVKIDSASVADDEYARFTASGLESRSTAEVLSDIGASPVAGSSSIVTTGALDAGSITSGFGAIDNGSSAITTTGVITGGTVEATTDTAAGDNAAIGYTSAEGLILTGQGSTSDVTIKNDADATVLSIPTGTTNVGIGTTAAATKLHIIDSLSGGQLLVANSESDNAVKYGTFGTQHYDTDQEPVLAISAESAASENNVLIGGALGEFNAATSVKFYTAANATTTGGSERMRITSDGKVGIGTTTPGAELGFPIGNDVEISQVAVTAHQAGNAGYIGLTIADGGGHAGFFVNNSHDGTYSDQHLTFKTGEGGVSASTERMRITPNGKVGIGTTTPDSYTSDTLVISSGDQGGMTLVSADNVENYISWADGTSGAAQLQAGFIGYNHASNYLRLGTVATERMRIDSSGNFLVGTTNTSLGIGNTNTGFQVENNGTFLASRADNVAGSLNRNNDGSILTVRRSGTEVGTIGVTASSTSYNTLSDYRLKENVNYTFDATTRLKQLKPARFNFIADSDNTVDGFLAHEVSSIVPEAITGTKDEVNSDGDPIYQSIDQSKLVPLLVKTIQELEARITALEAG